MKVFNKVETDFPSLLEYNNYLEEVEDISEWLWDRALQVFYRFFLIAPYCSLYSTSLLYCKRGAKCGRVQIQDQSLRGGKSSADCDSSVAAR